MTDLLESMDASNEQHQRFLKRCDTELLHITEQLQTLIAPQLKFYLQEELVCIATINSSVDNRLFFSD